MYVREYFDESARHSANEMVNDKMVNDIRSVFTEILDETTWMDEKTKAPARKRPLP